jgi:hypothetical protein
MIKLNKEAVQALDRWNRENYGQGAITSDPFVRDPDNIERIKRWAMPGETPSDTVIRVLSGPISVH